MRGSVSIPKSAIEGLTVSNFGMSGGEAIFIAAVSSRIEGFLVDFTRDESAFWCRVGEGASDLTGESFLQGTAMGSGTDLGGSGSFTFHYSSSSNLRGRAHSS